MMKNQLTVKKPMSMFLDNWFFVFVVAIAMVYFFSSLFSLSPILLVLLTFPALFLVPGSVLIIALGCETNSDVIELFVKGFFVSTGLVVAISGLMLLLHIPLTPITYSTFSLILVLVLTSISIIKKRNGKVKIEQRTLFLLMFFEFVMVTLFFNGIPRLFTPDETSYISSAVSGLLNGIMPPIDIRPDRIAIIVLIQGRYFWLFLLTAFLGSTALLPANLGLIGAIFFIMTALAATLFVDNKWAKIAVFLIITLNPLILIFSSLTLNDMAIAFFAIFTSVYFIKAFSRENGEVVVSISNLIISLLGVIIQGLIKLNLLIVVSLWLILVFVILRYRVYRENFKYKLLLVFLVIPVLCYEVFLDLPYVVAVWILRNPSLGNIFGIYLFVSPLERVLSWFVTPWWNPTAPTIYTGGFMKTLDYAYLLLSPEVFSLILSAIILAIPFLILSKEIRFDLERTLLAVIVFISLSIFYMDAIARLVMPDVGRLSLWLIPLWIPLAVLAIQKLLTNYSNKKAVVITVIGFLLLIINLAIQGYYGGIGAGYGFIERLFTFPILLVQFLLIAILFLVIGHYEKRSITSVKLSSRRLGMFKRFRIEEVFLLSILVFILISGLFFTPRLFDNTWLYDDHELDYVSSSLDQTANPSDLVFSNNYIYMRPYLSQERFAQNLFLPVPAKSSDLSGILKTAPSNTYLLVSDDESTAWYEYGNTYIKKFAYSEIITPDAPTVPILPDYNLSMPVVNIPFEGVNSTTLLDISGFNNHGINFGTSNTSGYYGNALQFNGKSYATIPDVIFETFDRLTISFFAKIKFPYQNNNYVLLSKGNAATYGSFTINILNQDLYFQVGNIGYIYISAIPYVGSWHHFLFSLGDKSLRIYVDGSLLAAKRATGQFRSSPYEIELGRCGDSHRDFYYGAIDQLQISNRPQNFTDFASHYFSCYAIRIRDLQLTGGHVGIFRVVNEIVNESQVVSVQKSSLTIDVEKRINVEIVANVNHAKDITIVIGTDRFTIVNTISLVPGTNNINFVFNLLDQSEYWPYLDQVTLVITEENNVIHTKVLTIRDIESVQILFTISIIGVISLYLITIVWRKQSED